MRCELVTETGVSVLGGQTDRPFNVVGTTENLVKNQHQRKQRQQQGRKQDIDQANTHQYVLLLLLICVSYLQRKSTGLCRLIKVYPTEERTFLRGC